MVYFKDRGGIVADSKGCKDAVDKVVTGPWFNSCGWSTCACGITAFHIQSYHHFANVGYILATLVRNGPSKTRCIPCPRYWEIMLIFGVNNSSVIFRLSESRSQVVKGRLSLSWNHVRHGARSLWNWGPKAIDSDIYSYSCPFYVQWVRSNTFLSFFHSLVLRGNVWSLPTNSVLNVPNSLGHKHAILLKHAQKNT